MIVTLIILAWRPAGFAAEAGKSASPKWAAATVEAELKRLEPVLKELGLKDPFGRARQLVGLEKDWTSAQTQKMWQSRIDYWRAVLLDEEGASWSDLLDFEHPALASSREALSRGGQEARRAWAAHVRTKPDLREDLRDPAVRNVLFETHAWSLYGPEGEFLRFRAEELLAGRTWILDQRPAQRDPDGDYDWLVQHPQDLLHHHSHQSAWQFKYVALAHFHQPHEKWAREFQNEVLMHIALCPELPTGYSDFGRGDAPGQAANVSWSRPAYVTHRLRQIVLTYFVLKDSPAMSPRFHGILARTVRAHASHLDACGLSPYASNQTSAAGPTLYLVAAMFAEFRQSPGWLERMWPNFLTGLRRELLPDGCHRHRSYSYHMSFIRRPLLLVHVARKLGRMDELPQRFMQFESDAIDAFARVATPIRSSPGINDDWTVAIDVRDVFHVGAKCFGRDDWLYIATDGKRGQPPRELCSLLPAAQLVTMRSDWSRAARWLFFNVSPDGGHHHPDTLSIQIWVGGRRLLTDPGTGHYYMGKRRLYGRSWWHNCPTFGAQQLPNNPSPKVLHYQTAEDLTYAVGQIEIPQKTGQPPARFRRHVFFADRNWWLLWDEFSELPVGRPVWENFHFPTEKLKIAPDGRRVSTSFPEGGNLLMLVGQPDWKLQQEETKYWLKYGGKPNQSLTVHYEADAAVASRGFGALFVPFDGQVQLGGTALERIERLADGRVRLVVTVAGKRRELTTHDLKGD